MLPVIADFLAEYRPWDLWVGADGGFRRDGGRCAIEALQFGWSAWNGAHVLQLVATVRHDTSNDVTANEPQILTTFDGDSLDGLRLDIARLREHVDS